MAITKTDIINDLKNDGFPQTSDVFYECDNGKVSWISLPNIWNININESYYYVLQCKNGTTKHISACDVINSNPKYKRFLKTKKNANNNTCSNVKNVLKLSKKHQQKKKVQKLLKKNKKKWKKKFIRRGKKMAYKKVFKDNMGILGQRMGARLNNKSLGRSKSVRKQISETLMNKYGKKKLEKCAGNKEELQSLFGAQNFKKTDVEKGTFKMYNMSQTFSRSKWFNVKFNVKHKAKGKKNYTYENGVFGH